MTHKAPRNERITERVSFPVAPRQAPPWTTNPDHPFPIGIFQDTSGGVQKPHPIAVIGI